MAGPRLFYVARPFGMPLGGVATLFRHVELLVDRGFDAFIYLLPGEGDLFVRHRAPVIDARQSLDTTPEDIFVLPEAWVCHLPEILSLPVRRYVFCQNHFYAFSGLGAAPTYDSLGIEGVIASSRVIAETVFNWCGVSEAPVIPYAIDHALFRPRAKQRQIAFMPRKLGLEADFIRGLFSRRHRGYADIPWIPIDRLPIEDVALWMGESRWFLSLSHLEGFGLPPVEAMAAEALVVGFHGEGGLDYATRANGYWCPTGDLEGCVAALARAVALADAGLSESLLAGGRATAAQYNRAAQEAALVDLWTSVIERRAHQSVHIER